MESTRQYKIVIGADFVKTTLVEALVIYQTAGLVDDYEREDSPRIEQGKRGEAYRSRASTHT